jgi:transcriptional regulator with XRE-family HTH domain
MLNLKQLIKEEILILEEKTKRDRCLRIADRKYDKPSAYKSGAVVRCRKGDIWKDLKEEEIPGGLAKGLTIADIAKMHKISVSELNDYLKKGIEVELEHTTDKKIAKEIALDHLYEDPKYYEKLKKIEEDESLHKWFKRQGTPGKQGGWVDCNSPIRKDGEITGYKPCGRKEGEKRSKYPACRPTAAKCKDPGKGEKWGKTK